VRTAVVLLTRDLRVHDNPALHAACASADHVVPLFVVDPAISMPANRRRFLAESLADLRKSLRQRGGDLVIRRGDPVRRVIQLARAVDAGAVFTAADASGYASSRERRLGAACTEHRIALKVLDAVTVVPPGALRPSGGGDHYRVFTPYWRAWQGHRRRTLVPAPRHVPLPAGVAPGQLPAAGRGGSPDPVRGGESAGRDRLARWRRLAAGYAEHHDDLAADRTSRLSAYLHFGCVSPVEVASTVDSTEFVRQLCWRDFYHQVLAAFPGLRHSAYRPGAVETWRDDADALEAWHAGQTGVAIVDAGMRQLLAEGFMHNRARLITASYLTKHLGLDWREGGRWFDEWLLDADVANNYGNWQWVAGTGNDTKPYRRFSPERQAQRFDPDGAYVRRWALDS
jgi:deoxyribodipyrimidine photo-lyase